MAWPDEPAVPPVIQLKHRYSKGDVVQAQRHTGWYYRAETDGETPAGYPESYPREAGRTFEHGTVVFLTIDPKSLVPA